MLHILIIPENMQRGDRILDAIYTVETEPITEYSRARKTIRTKGGTLYAVSRPEARFLMGYRADQVILDLGDKPERGRYGYIKLHNNGRCL